MNELEMKALALRTASEMSGDVLEQAKKIFEWLKESDAGSKRPLLRAVAQVREGGNTFRMVERCAPGTTLYTIA